MSANFLLGFQSLIGILVDFNANGKPEDDKQEFQSLIGILVDFNVKEYSCLALKAKFQSLIGILVDFNFVLHLGRYRI